jgi:hypothetical protein
LQPRLWLWRNGSAMAGLSALMKKARLKKASYGNEKQHLWHIWL